MTVRSRKRTTGSTTSSVAGDDSAFSTPYSSSIQGRQSRAATSAGIPAGKHVPRLSTSGVGRLSFGPLPHRDGGHGAESRPSSRASAASYARPVSRTDMRDVRDARDARDMRDMFPPRPMSRTSFSGARTPMGRPRSSLGGSLHSHGHSTSINDLPEDEVDTSDYQTPSRRGTYSRYDMDNTLSSIPTPSGIPLPGGMRRQSGGLAAGSTMGIPLPMGRRASTSMK